ncbi:hypothetical protein CALCODRAFT_410961, partial [Calocera cornea HHB12733]
SKGYRYIAQARCSLSSYPEFRVLRHETGRALADFLFENVICRWGQIGKIVTDNGTPWVAAVSEL